MEHSKWKREGYTPIKRLGNYSNAEWIAFREYHVERVRALQAEHN